MFRRVAVAGLLAVLELPAETGRDAWLRYAPLDQAATRQYRATLPAVVSTLNSGPLIDSARTELIRGVRGMVGQSLRVESRVPAEPSLLLGTSLAFRESFPGLGPPVDLPDDGYWLKTVTLQGV